MAEDAYTLVPYSPAALAEALSNEKTTTHQVSNNQHYIFFREYFDGQNGALEACTIVIEHQYVSRSYLNDYASFYATCFGPYERFCKRVHFFSCEISNALFREMITSPDAGHEPTWLQYLGNIVVKPLPRATVGATLLKSYDSTTTDKRFFPCTKEYAINVFGKHLKLQTLAFQEQDPAVGACATTALWSAFQKTCQLFNTPVPSPSAITRSARNSYTTSGRMFPNSGLSYAQIGSAIEAVGLEFELWNKPGIFNTLSFARAIIYAYGRMGLPVLLTIDIEEAGNHLVLVTGYKQANDWLFPKTSDISLRAYKIARFYAHDDRIGPFSRLGFVDVPGQGEFIQTWWKRRDGGDATGRLKSIIVPLHSKIRLTFENIIASVKQIDIYMNQSLGEDFELYWDVYLDFSNQYKAEMARISELTEDMRYSLMTANLPKYIWVAKGYVKGECVMELLFDATEIASADHCMRIHMFNLYLASFLENDLQRASVKAYFNDYAPGNYYELMTKAAANPATIRRS